MGKPPATDKNPRAGSAAAAAGFLPDAEIRSGTGPPRKPIEPPPARARENCRKYWPAPVFGSRREMERWIEEGVSPSTAGPPPWETGWMSAPHHRRRASAGAGARRANRCIVYHKPVREVCSRKDPEGRRTVFERLAQTQVRPLDIHRPLDFNTSGLLLFTTDGDLANALMHPSANIEREYMVRVMGKVEMEMLHRMVEGVMLEDGMARFTDITDAGGEGINHWFYVVIMEGRNREVRRLWESRA